MRIIAGLAKGRPLDAVAGSTRPTSDRAREALFSTLASEFGDFESLRVLDLYAGTGGYRPRISLPGRGACARSRTR